MKGISVALGSLLLVSSMFFSLTSMAHEHESPDVHSCIPKNDIRIPATELVNRGATQADYEGVIADIDSIYGRVFGNQGYKLEVSDLWDDSTVNASAEKTRWGTRRVNIYGGLARYPGMTKDALLMAACHEVGHHIGGAPMYQGEWASAEAQSDYFATKNCAKRIWRESGKMEGFSYKNVDPKVITDCEKLYSQHRDQKICVRSVIASQILSDVLAELTYSSSPKYDSPDTSQSPHTNESYPSVQCRFDSFIAGAHCDVDIDDVPSSKSVSKGSCTRLKGDDVGTRPLCWFKPSSRLALFQ